MLEKSQVDIPMILAQLLKFLHAVKLLMIELIALYFQFFQIPDLLGKTLKSYRHWLLIYLNNDYNQ